MGLLRRVVPELVDARVEGALLEGIRERVLLALPARPAARPAHEPVA